MNSYRSTLYAAYSSTFGEGKPFATDTQWPVYEGTYTLPASRDLAVADIGCGHGEWLLWMKSKGFSSLRGFEFSESEPAKELEKQHIPITFGDAVESLEGFPQAFDLIHAKDVIEHFTKDEMVVFLQTARKALRPGGVLWLLTFNAQAPLANATRYGDFTHESGFTPMSLAQVVRATGFREVHVRGIINHSGSWKSALRVGLYRMLSLPPAVLLRLRHGGGSNHASVLPDLFATARI